MSLKSPHSDTRVHCLSFHIISFSALSAVSTKARKVDVAALAFSSVTFTAEAYGIKRFSANLTRSTVVQAELWSLSSSNFGWLEPEPHILNGGAGT